jgi:hypothetical protein
MSEPLVDVDLDALAPRPIRARLGGKTYKLPGDMPLELFFRIQAFEQRVEKGENEMTLLSELRDEILALFQVHQPQMKTLPDMGVTTLLQALGAIYGGAPAGPPTRTPTPPSKKRTPSSGRAAPARRATSR